MSEELWSCIKIYSVLLQVGFDRHVKKQITDLLGQANGTDWNPERKKFLNSYIQ